AEDNGLKTICVTDHYWDETVPSGAGLAWYLKQDTAKIKEALPLPRKDGIRFLFGAECEMDINNKIGISEKMARELEFIIVPINHLHLAGITSRGDETPKERAEMIVRRFDTLLDSGLPMKKVGLAHFTDGLMYTAGTSYDVLSLIPESEYRRLFGRAAEAGMGIELNIAASNPSYGWYNNSFELGVYMIAREMGCRFYFGSDAHTVKGLLAAKEKAEKTIDLLRLTEDDKFELARAV
nr:hypothetical protein [Clostridiales bacterium]